MDQYRVKPKRPYTGPPRPNLMKHDGQIKDINQQVQMLQQTLAQTQEENRRLHRRLNELEYQIQSLKFPKPGFPR
jgi:chromosome segregation ATPase